MTSVVEQFDILEQVTSYVIYCIIIPSVNPLFLKCGEETLYAGIIIRATWSTHAARDPVLRQHLFIALAGVLCASFFCVTWHVVCTAGYSYPGTNGVLVDSLSSATAEADNMFSMMCFAVLTRISSEYFELLLGMSFSSCFYPYGITESTGHFFTALHSCTKPSS